MSYKSYVPSNRAATLTTSSPTMISKAVKNAAASNLTQVEFEEAEMTALPLPDACIDVVISSGAINLAADKDAVSGEVYRVLRPGSRLQIADMVRAPSQDHSACCGGEESWADCVSGTLEPDVFLSMLTRAGFVDVELAGFTGYKTAASTVGALLRAVKPY